MPNVLELTYHARYSYLDEPKRSVWRLGLVSNPDSAPVTFPQPSDLRGLFKEASKTKKGRLIVEENHGHFILFSLPSGLEKPARTRLLDGIERRMKVLGTLPKDADEESSQEEGSSVETG